MPELWNKEECSCFSEVPVHGEGGSYCCLGRCGEEQVVIQVLNTRACVGRGH